ncbi:hypothetical protein BJX65DRAFT_237538 [Aspergillus insuetus]
MHSSWVNVNLTHFLADGIMRQPSSQRTIYPDHACRRSETIPSLIYARKNVDSKEQAHPERTQWAWNAPGRSRPKITLCKSTMHLYQIQVVLAAGSLTSTLLDRLHGFHASRPRLKKARARAIAKGWGWAGWRQALTHHPHTIWLTLLLFVSNLLGASLATLHILKFSTST